MPPPTPYWHYVDELIAETALGAKLALTSSFAVETRWALRVVDVNPTYGELDGTPKLVPDDIHHHDETLVDASDPWFVGSFFGGASGFSSAARFGFALPIGRTEEDPYALGAKGLRHEHIQGGTGTVVPIVGFDVAYTFARTSIAPVTAGFDGTALFGLYANDKGYQPPTRFDFGHTVSVALFDRRLTPAVSLRVGYTGEERWHGALGGEGSLERTEVFLGGSLAWRFVQADRISWWMSGSASGRIATSADEHDTLNSAGLFSFSVGATFDLWDTDDERRARGETIEEGSTIRRTEHDGVVEFEKD